MRAFLVISSRNEIAELIRASLPQGCCVDQADNYDQALRAIQKKSTDVVFLDLGILDNDLSDEGYEHVIQSFKAIQSFVQIVVVAPKERIRDAVKAVKAGASDYLTCPIDPSEVRLIFDSLNESRAQKQELTYLRDHFWKSEWLHVIHTRSAGMEAVFKKVRAVAPTIATVLLIGETGTGKGLLARLLHRHSNRSDEPFVSVHCGAIPETLLESELFGHEKGAFTGAVRQKPGKFELACNGTIFLDEIGTITHAAQVKLLQVLQDGTFSRVGGERVLSTNARVISATNSDLPEMIEKESFRKDLYYRLNIFPIELPPLRQRADDIPYLIEVFLKKLNQKHGKNIHTVQPHVIQALKNYHWPGNIRELENLMERAYILETGSVLTPDGFPAELYDSDIAAAVLPVDIHLPLAEARRQATDDFERQYLKELFARHRGKVKLVAEGAGITTRQLNKLMLKYNIKKEMFKT
jgi:DNA-binding NtrC family response regulator